MMRLLPTAALCCALLQVPCWADSTLRWNDNAFGYWENPNSWTPNRPPGATSVVSIATTREHWQTSVLFPRRVNSAFASLETSAKNSPNDMLQLMAEQAKVYAGESVIGSETNKGDVLLSLSMQSLWQSLNPSSEMKIASSGSGKVYVKRQSNVFQPYITIAENHGSTGMLDVRSQAFVRSQEITLGSAGSGTIYLSEGGRLQTEQLKTAIERTRLLQPGQEPAENPDDDEWQLSRASIRLTDAGTRLAVLDTLWTPSRGILLMSIQNEAILYAENFRDQSLMPAAMTNIAISNEGELSIQSKMEIGKFSQFTMNIAQKGVLEAISMILSAPQNGVKNTVLVNNHSTIYAYDVLSIADASGVVEMTINKQSEMRAREKLLLGFSPEAHGILTIDNESTFTGRDAKVGVEGKGTLVIGNHSSFTLDGTLTIAQEFGSTGTVTLSTDEMNSSQYGPRLTAQQIILGLDGDATIDIENHCTDTTAALIQANIHGSGTIHKRGSGILTMRANQSWAGTLHLEDGLIEIPDNSTLSTRSSLRIHQNGILKIGNHSQTIAEMQNSGKVVIQSPSSNRALRILGDLQGYGKYLLKADLYEMNTDMIFVNGQVSGAHGLFFTFQPEPIYREYAEVHVAHAGSAAEAQPLFFLQSGMRDGIGMYQDLGFYRYDLQLRRDIQANGANDWYLTRKKRQPSTCPDVLHYACFVSDKGHSYIGLQRKRRSTSNALSRGAISPKMSLYPKVALTPLVVDSRIMSTPFSLVDAPSQMIGVSYSAPLQNMQYHIDVFETKQNNNHVQHTSHAPETFTTRALRLRWEHVNGWRSYIGVEQSETLSSTTIQQQEASLRNPTSTTRVGLGYFWNLPSDWGVGPHAHYTKWRDNASAFARDVASQTIIYAQAQHAQSLDLGIQAQYPMQSSLESNWSLHLAGHWKQHREQLRLSSAEEHLVVPLNFETHELSAQWNWQPSPHALVSMAAQYTHQPKFSEEWNVAAYWQYRF